MPTPRRARGLSEADRALWATYASQIAPLSRRSVKKPSEPATALAPDVPLNVPLAVSLAAVAVAQPRGKLGAPVLKSRVIALPLAVGTPPGGIDKATWQRFRSGKLLTARTLDLHGMTAQRAFHALVSFLRSAHAEQVRCVEVVTGRGSGEAGGVIRREFPHWLNLPEIRPLILGAAHPHALNTGSVRLILRRIR